MTRQFSKTIFSGLIAILAGVAAHQLWAAYGPGNRCGGDGSAVVSCPATGICQPPGHCKINQYHKCINQFPNDEFPYCVIWPNFDFQQPDVACQFEAWNFNCGAPLGIFWQPLCYEE
jgi:hypothetical protein